MRRTGEIFAFANRTYTRLDSGSWFDTTNGDYEHIEEQEQIEDLETAYKIWNGEDIYGDGEK